MRSTNLREKQDPHLDAEPSVFGPKLSEFIPCYRLYSVDALRTVPLSAIQRFHFDTEIIIQLMFFAKREFASSPSGLLRDEICRVNGTKYAFNVMFSTVRARLQN